MDAFVSEATRRAVAGEGLSRDGVMRLLAVAEGSDEARYVCEAALRLSREAAGGLGVIHAQIGVDGGPCPKRCDFCSFSASAQGAADDDAWHGEAPLDEILRAARVFDEGGVHLISLMATAALPMSRLAVITHEVRGVVSPDVAIMVNAGDMSFEGARMLRDVGADAIYHARRVCEGEITSISPDVRLATMANARHAGLALMTGVEPVWRDAPLGELADRMLEVASLGSFCTGVCALTNVRGTAMEDVSSVSRERLRLVASVLRLVVGRAAPLGCAGGAVWVDAGCDPRSRGMADDSATLRRKVAEARRRLKSDGWTVATRADYARFLRRA